MRMQNWAESSGDSARMGGIDPWAKELDVHTYNPTTWEAEA